MASQDSNPQGGSITDMAAQGTKVPDDAATQNTIPSVPRPDQRTDSSNDSNDLGATDLAGVADNFQDISRPSYKDVGLILSPPHCRLHAITPLPPRLSPAQADALPSEIGLKPLHNDVSPDLSKGHQRYDKHVRQKGNDQDKGASDGVREDEIIDGVIGGR